ncbi:MAG: DUF177 domain-containing protein [Clostridia bacterium]|nr:DUF177 domain-containing protein [Clostridia bacterium]
MVLDITSILSGEKSRLDIDYMLTIPKEATDTRSMNLSDVSFPTAARVTGQLTDNAGYMRLTLSVVLPYVTLCARCAREVRGEFAIDFARTVVTEGMIEDAEKKEEDFAVSENGKLDIDGQLIEILSLEFPMRILCKEDCKGLCPRCGKDLNDGPCDCRTGEIHPAFAAILKQFEEKEK